MKYSIDQISKILNASYLQKDDPTIEVSNIIFDTRKISQAKHSIFLALEANSDGHNFVQEAYDKGIRNFIVSKEIISLAHTNVLLVSDTLAAIQTLGESHRKHHDLQTIGITGSNGKTIVKEWLSEVLDDHYQIVKSPKSFNSQLGVPLSVLAINDKHELAIFEAGISKPNEMDKLQAIIQPDIGIFTHLGDAHSAGFDSLEQKLDEKLLLFKDSIVLIYNQDDILVSKKIQEKYPDKELIGWGKSESSSIKILNIEKTEKTTRIKILYQQDMLTVNMPFGDDASIENGMHVISCSLFLGLEIEEVIQKISAIKSVPLRMEIKKGRQNTLLINDSYSADFSSFKIALEFLSQKSGEKKRHLIFSDLEQQFDSKNAHLQLAQLFKEHKIDQLFYIGEEDKFPFGSLDAIPLNKFKTTEDFIQSSKKFDFEDSVILLKGARKYRLEKIFNHLEAQVHQTVLQINLSHLSFNIDQYKNILKPSTAIMAVIKAAAYGSGSEELASFLASKQIDYLGVALADEGVEIRKQGIDVPILVFNIQEQAFNLLWDYNLEPEVFSLAKLERLCSFSKNYSSAIAIHLKLDTGMRRLGFFEEELPQVIQLLQDHPKLKVKSIFSHLSSSEDLSLKSETENQFKLYERMYVQISTSLAYQPMRHILNSSGVTNFPSHQYDMVRLGLGLYGIHSNESELELKSVHTLKSSILQIKKLKKGEATGYGRHAVADQDITIAIVAIGYADGLMRSSGNGNYQLTIRGQLAPLVGNVCMDVCMVDISQIENVSLLDEVIIFQSAHELKKLANANNTIPYEVLSRISKRVKRIYLEE